MQFINPNQAKITTTGFAPGEARILTTEEATLLFGGGTIFRVSEPGPLILATDERSCARRTVGARTHGC